MIELRNVDFAVDAQAVGSSLWLPSNAQPFTNGRNDESAVADVVMAIRFVKPALDLVL
jgi:hypothetical protein